jgi:hypothetical protein
MSDFTDEMDKLAAQIAKDVQADAIALGDRIDAFKALTPYYVWQMKNKGKDDPDDGLPNFENFTSSIHATENDDGEGEPGLRDRRRNGN